MDFDSRSTIANPDESQKTQLHDGVDVELHMRSGGSTFPVAGNDERSPNEQSLNEQSVDVDTEPTNQAEHKEMKVARLEPIFGWRLWITITCLCSGLLLSSLETTIIATALVSISSSLGSYERSNWVVTAYLLTYTGFLISLARISDLFGRKITYCFSIVIFTIFSLACGLSQTMDQLIVFRAFQGIGGAGLYSMAMSVIAEITPLKYIGVSSGLMGSVFAISSLLGPVLGGVITSQSTWRWVFYLNVAPGLAILGLVLLFFPPNVGPLPIKRRTFTHVDYLGISFSLLGSVMLVFALEGGGLAYHWNSPIIIASFIVSGMAFIAFAFWERLISGAPKLLKMPPTLPLFPFHLITQRVLGFAFMAGFVTGFPFMVTIVFLPQRFQLQNDLSPVAAGIRMLPLLLLSAVGAGLGGVISSFRNISWYLLVFSLGLQILGLGLMSTLPTTPGDVHQAQYGYQAILGLGFGLSLSSLVIVARMEVKVDTDVTITISVITQVRVLGGVIGIAIAQALINEKVLVTLTPILSSEKLKALLRSTEAIAGFTPDEIAATIRCYGDAFNLQNKVMAGLSGMALLIALGAWKRKVESFDEIEARRLDALPETQRQLEVE